MKYIWHILFSKLHKPKNLADLDETFVEAETFFEAARKAQEIFEASDVHILEIRRGKRA